MAQHPICNEAVSAHVAIGHIVPSSRHPPNRKDIDVYEDKCMHACSLRQPSRQARLAKYRAKPGVSTSCTKTQQQCLPHFTVTPDFAFLSLDPAPSSTSTTGGLTVALGLLQQQWRGVCVVLGNSSSSVWVCGSAVVTEIDHARLPHPCFYMTHQFVSNPSVYCCVHRFAW